MKRRTFDMYWLQKSLDSIQKEYEEDMSRLFSRTAEDLEESQYPTVRALYTTDEEVAKYFRIFMQKQLRTNPPLLKDWDWYQKFEEYAKRRSS